MSVWYEHLGIGYIKKKEATGQLSKLATKTSKAIVTLYLIDLP